MNAPEDLRQRRELAWAAYERRLAEQGLLPGSHVAHMRAAFMAGWYDGSWFAFDTSFEDAVTQ